MQIFAKLSFRSKINLGVIAVILIFGIVLAFLVSRVVATAMSGEIKKRGMNLSMNLAGRATNSILALDFLRLKNMADEVVESSDDIAYAFIQDVRGQVLSHTFKSGFPSELQDANPIPPGASSHIQLLDAKDELIYDFALPVKVGENRLGTVRVGLSRAKAEAAVRGLLLTIFGVSAGVALVAVAMGTLFASTVTRRLNVLRQSAEEMIKGNLFLHISPRLQRNCWEIRDCKNEQCPAYGDTRRRCWNLPGTLCPECREGSYEDKLSACKDCLVHQINVGDEIQSLAESFEVMAMTLDAHIQELEEAKKNLIRQQQLLKTILDVNPDLVSLQDENLVYQAVNPAFSQFCGLTEQEILGKTEVPLFPPEEAGEHQLENLQLLKTGGYQSKEVLVGKDGEKRWLHMVKVPVYDEDRITGILMAARDITEIKQYQEKLIQSLKMEQLGKLAGGVAHEINTPLCVILGYAQMLLEDLPQDTESYEFLQLIEKQAQICRRIVGDLLSFSRHIESRMEEMDLNRSITEVLDLVRHSFKQDWIDIAPSLAPDLPAIIGDKERLQQVWLNLLNNAVDSIGQDGGIWISTRLDPQSRRVQVTVADNGAGIAPENLKKIFDPFFTTKAPGGGTGLGLSVSFGIIQDHLGTITALSPAPSEFLEETGRDKTPPRPGSVFVVELPVSREKSAADTFTELSPETPPVVDQTMV
ncbi:MAG: PAS domain S-box protein [Deltaproteobacteria bacterium]|nr:PAS domain S-box protein [Deltaproteobacteria bacterium]MBI4794903.1 PAS domain S-box protein [Deltaproteobacteria bacterium]